jgi:hypothetical protein
MREHSTRIQSIAEFSTRGKKALDKAVKPDGHRKCAWTATAIKGGFDMTAMGGSFILSGIGERKLELKV